MNALIVNTLSVHNNYLQPPNALYSLPVAVSPAVELGAPPASGGCLSAVYQTYAVYLKYLYSRTHENKWPQNTISSYVPLATVLKPRISRDQADKFTRATLHHGIDEILAEKEPTTMEDILKPLKGQSKVSCVLVEGPPGVGKSTFAWQLCQRWDGIPELKKFSLVVLLRFREKRVQEAKDIADLFFHDDASLQKAVAKEVCSRNGEGVLLILDGFDELPASLRKRSFLVNIIEGSRIPGCTVVVTSRPSATADLFDSCRVDKHIEVLGFTQREIEEYASIAFASEPQLLDDFHRYRKINPAIKSMMYIPLNTVIVADVFLTARGKPLSHTTTQLYVEMIFVFLIRYLKANGEDELAAKLPTRLEDLPSDIRSHLLKLGKMAFDGVVNEEVIFNELPTECEHFGLINASPELYITRPATSYNFLHRSVQELFTAFHISQLPPNKQKEIFQQYKPHKEDYDENFLFSGLPEDDRFREVWRFVAGLTGFKVIGWEEVKSRSSTKELVSYLYEAQDMAACDSVLGEREQDFTASSLSDCHAAGWCIAASECRLRLSFGSMGYGAEVCEAFASGVKSRKEVRGSVSRLHLSHTHIEEESVVHLMELPSSVWHKTSSLDVSYCELNACAMAKVADFVRIHMNSLKELKIEINEVGKGGFVKLFHTLSQHGFLKRLTIGRNLMGCADVKTLAHVIRPDSGRLKELTIDERILLHQTYTHMSPECQTLLVETLLQPSSLDTLLLYNVDVSSACDSFALLADNPNLTSITVGNIGPALPSLLKGLEGNKSVKTIQLDSLKSAECAATVKMLSVNTCLEALNIQYFSLLRKTVFSVEKHREHHRKACLDIINALQTNNTLKRLELHVHTEWINSASALFTQTEKDKMDSRVILSEERFHCVFPFSPF